MDDIRGMVDVSGKDITVRTATAQGTIALGPDAFEAVRTGDCRKGNVLETARIAAIGAVKSTASLIPMCHTIPIEAVAVDFELDEAGFSVIATVKVKSTGRTGVEMEALTGASMACLTIYDMLKYTGKNMIIERIQLMEKTGGASGDYKRCD